MQTHPVNPCLICSSCSSDQSFAADFLQIPPRDGHPCPWLTVGTINPRIGLAPTSKRPCWAHIKKPPQNLRRHDYNGDPGGIRTPDLLIRSQVLYPAELRSHVRYTIKLLIKYIETFFNCQCGQASLAMSSGLQLPLIPVRLYPIFHKYPPFHPLSLLHLDRLHMLQFF